MSTWCFSSQKWVGFASKYTYKTKKGESTYSEIKDQRARAAQPVGHIPDQVRPLRRVQEDRRHIQSIAHDREQEHKHRQTLT